jgi:hypothetical protein
MWREDRWKIIPKCNSGKIKRRGGASSVDNFAILPKITRYTIVVKIGIDKKPYRS